MKIIFINCWYAKRHSSFYNFIQNHKNNTDVFCFVEVNPENFQEFSIVLDEFQGCYETYNLFTISNCIYGQAIFVKKGINITENGKFRVYKNSKNDVGFIQTMTLKLKNNELHIANVHGKTHPGSKNDTPIRIKQTEKIINFFKNKVGEVIIGGDFNLLPDTKSIALFEDNGYLNLVKRFKVKSTRNRIAWENFKNEPGFVKQYYADYCFVSKDVKVKSFIVPDIEVSDHLPLILEFQV